MKPLDGPSMIALVLIASFAIDRIVTATLFLLSFIRTFPDPSQIGDPAERVAVEKKCKLLYFFFGAVFAVMFLASYGQVRILSALRLPANVFVDTILTGIVLLGGADRIAALLKVPSVDEGDKSAAQPIQVTGKLTLEEAPREKASQERAPHE